MGRGKKRRKSKSSPVVEVSASKRVAMATNQQQSQNVQNSQLQASTDQICNNTNYNQQQTNQNYAFSPVNHMQNQQYYPPTMPVGPPGGGMASPSMSHYTLPPPGTPLQSTARDDQWSLIINRLEGIDKRLTQLDTINSTVNKITDRLDSLDQKTTRLEHKIQDMENSRAFDTSSLDQIQKKQKEIEQMLKSVKTLEKEQETRERQLKEEILDLKSRSMRDNLIFFGFEEERDEKDSDCVNKVLSLIEEKLEIPNAKAEIKLQRAHRMGKFNPNKTRPIVAKFAFYPDRERVRQNAKKLQIVDGSWCPLCLTPDVRVRKRT